MQFWTAQYRYPGPYRLDISLKGQHELGIHFAPAKNVLWGYKNGNITQQQYVEEYRKILVKAEQSGALEKLLNKQAAVLVCFCPTGNFCHRHILTEYLKSLGATYYGEITNFDPWKKGVIDSFDGPYRFLSNFYPGPFTYNGIYYPTNEHFFQTMKTTNLEEQKVIAAASTPGRAKRAGRKVQIRPDWDNVKDDIMKQGLWMKFSNNPNLKNILLSTTNKTLIEGNTWHDNYWGNCICGKCTQKQGLNKLGTFLMELRDYFNQM